MPSIANAILGLLTKDFNGLKPVQLDNWLDLVEINSH